MSEITPELKTYHGNCHCGAFKFTIKMPEITTVTQCNCSICFKKGYRWVFPGEGCFEITKGEGALKDYHFGQRTMAHRVTPPTIYLTRMVLMDLVLSNMWIEYTRIPLQHSSGKRHWYQCKLEVNSLQDVDQWSLKVNKYDGLDREPQYVALTYTAELPLAKFESETLYTGGCHCGAVTIAFKTQAPLPKRHEHIQECNCSICCRLGITICYPKRDQVSVSGISNLTEYSFGQSYNIFRFCSTCGITVDVEKDMNAVSKSPKTWESLTPAQRERWPTIHSINLRCFEGIEWDDISIYKANTRAIDPQYVVPE
ncbi:hypothetical protein ACHAPC_008533 [Botrytis cinerea]